MKLYKGQAAKRVLIALLLAVTLVSCTKQEGFSSDGQPTLSNPEFERTPPPIALAEYSGANQAGPKEDDGRSGLIDMSNVAKGYIAAQCTAPTAAKISIMKDGGTGQGDIYSLDNTGVMNYFPITGGSGNYTFILYLQIEGTQYEQFLVGNAAVSLENEKAPYLVPSRIVEYSEQSAVVMQSYEITKNCSTDLEVVQQIYSWIAANISYDTDKAAVLANSTVDYIPNPDETLKTRTGICYDYASLAAAMLRANGIPTKLIKGDVLTGEGNSVYHAWNMVWLEGSGWVAVELAVSPSDWTRIDTTFAAAGKEMGSFIGDGKNYTPMSEH